MDVTYPFLTEYERCQVIAKRSQELKNDAKPFVDVGDISDFVLIAMLELKRGKLNHYVIIRSMPDGTVKKVLLANLTIL